MEFSIAKRIYDASVSMDEAIGVIDKIISNIHEDDGKYDWVARLGNVIRSINDDLIIPILKIYPNLDRNSS